ncbi:hypothetical protein [Aquabacterium sp.]|nr:hypothetical protein [Aquabacterium sp.]
MLGLWQDRRRPSRQVMALAQAHPGVGSKSAGTACREGHPRTPGAAQPR